MGCVRGICSERNLKDTMSQMLKNKQKRNKWSAQQQCNSSKGDSHIILIKLWKDTSRECISWQSILYGMLPHKETTSLLENRHLFFFCLTNECNCIVNFSDKLHTEVLPKFRLNLLCQKLSTDLEVNNKRHGKTNKLALKWTLWQAVRSIQSELTFWGQPHNAMCEDKWFYQ